MLKSFTLVELIIYIALVALVAVVAISFAWNIIDARTKNQVLREVRENVRFGLEKISQAAREADNISIPDSIFNLSPGKLTLIYPDKNIIFDVAAKTINVGGREVEIHKLTIKDGPAEAEDLTSNQVDVTEFKLFNLTRENEPKNIKIKLEIEYVNPGGALKWAAKTASETTVSFRISP